MADDAALNAHIDRLLANGVIDMHFDLLMDLYEKRERANVLQTDFLPGWKAGNVGALGAAIYVEDKYLPEMGLRVALDQVARLYAEVDQSDQFAICRSAVEIQAARQSGKIALLITMEGVEPLGNDINLLRVFYELGLRVLGLTHARRNAAGEGGTFEANGSSRGGVTGFGRQVLRECEELGIIVDLAHINPAGFEDIIALTAKPVIVSHTNVRRYYDVDRNIGDEQIKVIGARRGVIGVNAVLVSPHQAESTLNRYIDHIEHIANLIGIDSVGIGFDFFEFVYNQWSPEEQASFGARYANVHFVPNLTHHSHTRNLVRKLIERGFADADIEKILFRNWMRVFGELL
jgi:membrane dipeptidase